GYRDRRGQAIGAGTDDHSVVRTAGKLIARGGLVGHGRSCSVAGPAVNSQGHREDGPMASQLLAINLPPNRSADIAREMPCGRRHVDFADADAHAWSHTWETMSAINRAPETQRNQPCNP